MCMLIPRAMQNKLFKIQNSKVKKLGAPEKSCTFPLNNFSSTEDLTGN